MKIAVPPSWKLYPRLRFDISFADLFRTLGGCATSWSKSSGPTVLTDVWEAPPGKYGMVCLSARSAFHLLLGALELPHGSEILFSAITHPHLPRIAEKHGLCPIPVDLDVDTLSPKPDRLDVLVTDRTKMIVLSHLFGSLADVAAAARVARDHDLFLVEDCAQAYRGPGYAGGTASDVALFSFGTIKTATALRGAVVWARDRELVDRMEELQADWRLQSRARYAWKVLKLIVLTLIDHHPFLYRLLERAIGLCGKRFDETVNDFVHGFSEKELFDQIQQRPCEPLLALLRRRLSHFDKEHLARRISTGNYLDQKLPPGVVAVGKHALDRSFWVFPVIAPDRGAMIERLKKAGFDAARAPTGITVVDAPPGRDVGARSAEDVMNRISFLPAYPEIPRAEIDRMVDALG